VSIPVVVAVENLCSPWKKLDRVEDLNAVKSLLNKLHAKQVNRGVVKMENCIVLPVLDHKIYVPNYGAAKIPNIDYINRIKELQAQAEGGIVENNFSVLMAPVRLGGKWLLVICDMRREVAELVIFEEWKPEEKIIDIIVGVAHFMRIAALKCKLRTVTDAKLLDQAKDWKIG
jgi:hypothetical protein